MQLGAAERKRGVGGRGRGGAVLLPVLLGANSAVLTVA